MLVADTNTADDIGRLLEHFGISDVKGGDPGSETIIEQFLIFMEAMQTFTERNRKYKDLWKEYGAEDSLLHMRSKLSRFERVMREASEDENFDPEQVDTDDLIDLLNYGVFALRNLREGRVS